MTLKEKVLRHIKAKLKQLCLGIAALVLALLFWVVFFLMLALVIGSDMVAIALFMLTLVTFGSFPLFALLALADKIYDDLEKYF